MLTNSEELKFNSNLFPTTAILALALLEVKLLLVTTGTALTATKTVSNIAKNITTLNNLFFI
jgi:hypothetical protein